MAHRLRAGYPDGQLFLDLRGADRHPLHAAEVLARFLRTLGMPGEAIPNDVQERAALYRSLLADRRLLVVLDNAADEQQVRPLLPGTPSCAVLVTSRYRLAGLVGLASVDLGVLDTSGALALLERTAGAARVRAERAAAEELAGLCGGLPLALRVVGVKLATYPHRALSGLVERLVEERSRLDQLAHGGLAVRSNLDFSYQRLDPADRSLLRRASLLDAPDFAAWTAAAVSERVVPEVEDGLDHLVAAHLLQIAGTDVVDQVRYRMHDLIRVYARERAAAEDSPADRLAAVRRASHHWLGLGAVGEEAMFGDGYHARLGREVGHAVLDRAAVDRVSMDPLAWIEAERAAFVSAVRQAAAAGLLAECWRLGCVFKNMLAFRDFTDEKATVHTIAADAARLLGDRRAVAITQNDLGTIEYERGNLTRSRSMLEGAEAMVDASHDVDPAIETMGLLGLGQIRLFAGDPAAALPFLESAVQVSGRSAGMMPRLLVLLWYGEACLQLGDTTRAGAAFRELASWSQRVGATSGEVRSLCALAKVALADGDIDEAERLALRASRQCDLLDEVTSMDVSFTLARAQLAKGDHGSALTLAQDALDACRRLGLVVYQVRSLGLLAEIHEATGDHDAAAAARAEAATIKPAAQPA